MKSYNVTNRMSPQAKAAILNTLSTHDRLKKAYFFSPASHADGRRRAERNFAENNPPYQIVKGDDVIEVSARYEESCKNVYYRLSVTLNGEAKTVAALKKLIK